MPDFSFAKKQSFLRWGRLASGELPSVLTDARTHEDDENATSGIPDCPRVLPIGRRFCCRRLMPGDLASKAAARVTSFFAS